jgi:glyoxylate carboligase
MGDVQPFSPVPYFWSDQYGKKIQCLGRTAQFDEVRVVAGSVDGNFLALYRREDQLVAALGVSQIKALMGYRQRLLDGCSWEDALAAAPH